jgi:hypothetical protein
MTEITTAAATKRAASSFDLAGHPIPKFDLPNMEMPKAFHEMTEMGVAHAKDTYAKAKVATEEVADLLQNTYATLAKGANDYNLKLFEIVRVNSRSAFDYAQGLLGVKSRPSLSSAQRRRCASSSSCFPLTTRSFRHSLTRWRPGLQSQSRRACPKRSIRRPESRRRNKQPSK